MFQLLREFLFLKRKDNEISNKHMTSTALFYFIIAIIIVNFIKDKILNALNAKHFNDELPIDLKDVYDEKDYKKTNYKFGIITSSFSIILTIGFLLLDGFEFVDNLARSLSSNPIIIALVFARPFP